MYCDLNYILMHLIWIYANWSTVAERWEHSNAAEVPDEYVNSSNKLIETYGDAATSWHRNDWNLHHEMILTIQYRLDY